MTKTLRFAREAVLWTGGALGALCLVMVVAGWLFNVTPLVFASGSMSPTYETGALGIAREVRAPDLEVGDVVGVVNARGDRVTHRIVTVTANGDGALLTLQGDTNNVPDAETYDVTSVDRVAFGIPYAGYVLNAAASPFGLLVIGLLVAGSLWLGFSRADSPNRAATSVRVRVAVPAGVTGVVLIGAALGLTGQAPWAFTSAYWTDTASVTTTASVPAAPPAAPVIVAPCQSANGETGYTLNWTWGPGNPTSFKLYYGGGGSGLGPTTFAGTVRTGVSLPINDQIGTFRLTAVVGGVESAFSNTFNYSGKNNSKTCGP